MKYWQRERDYRKHVRKDGAVIYIITVDGEDVEVSAEVYAAYSQSERRERYQAERDSGRILSLERLNEDNVPLLSLTDKLSCSTEDTIFSHIDSERFGAALDRLTPEERRLIEALILDGVTEREYAARMGMSQKGVNKRKQKILQKISAFLVLKQTDFREGQ